MLDSPLVNTDIYFIYFTPPQEPGPIPPTKDHLSCCTLRMIEGRGSWGDSQCGGGGGGGIIKILHRQLATTKTTTAKKIGERGGGWGGSISGVQRRVIKARMEEQLATADSPSNSTLTSRFQLPHRHPPPSTATPPGAGDGGERVVGGRLINFNLAASCSTGGALLLPPPHPHWLLDINNASF